MIPPVCSVAFMIGFLKRNFTGRYFCARGYCVSTVGVDEETIKNYIEYQGRKDSGKLREEL